MGVEVEIEVFSFLVQLVEFSELGDAPAAAGPSAEAIADEGSDGGIFAFEIIDDFSFRDVEAEADFDVVAVVVVWGHGWGV